MSQIGERFARLRAQGRTAFIPYLTAGDPDLRQTRLFLHALARAGADVIEVGVPFSDPIADGPTIQRAAERGLRSGTTLAGVLDLLRREREVVGVPLVLFSYYNPIYRMGLEAFAAAARDGVDGVLVTDLPPEEAADYHRCLTRAGLDPVFLAAPTSPPERLREIAALTRGFLYYVSRTAVTGVQNDLPETLSAELATVRAVCEVPVAVGFGIATPAQATVVAGLADGVVVGSALVEIIAQQKSGQNAAVALQAFARELNHAIKQSASG